MGSIVLSWCYPHVMKITAALGAAVAAAGISLAVAPVAAADESSYLADINQGIGATEVVSGTWLALGYAACEIGNLEDATAYIWANTGDSVDAGEARFAAESAFMFLC
jgi:hypothetical protein